MARMTSRSVKPRDSLILGRHPDGPEGVLLRPRAVLPGDVHLEVPERDLGLDVERARVDALLRPRVPDQHSRVEPLRRRTFRRVVHDLWRAGGLAGAWAAVREE